MKKLLFAAALVAAAGCASVPLPAERLERQQATVRAAEELGAASLPRAKLHLQFAKDEEAWARQNAKMGDENAEAMLACAQADADLALELARQNQVHQQTLRAADEVNALRAKGVTP
jgi:hypothetical protein